jgi:hypothetical protein
MAHRPIPFSTPNSSISAKSPFYQDERKKKGKAISKGKKAAMAARLAAAEKAEDEDLAEVVTRR